MRQLIVLGRRPPPPVASSRGGHAKGRRQPQAKLRAKDIGRIRKLFIKSDRHFGGAALARKFRVSDTTIFNVVRRIAWKHLP